MPAGEAPELLTWVQPTKGARQNLPDRSE